MTEDLQLAMQACAENATAGENALLALMSHDRDRFVRTSLPLLRDGSDSPGYESLVKLLAPTDLLLSQLCDPRCFSKEAAIELARQVVRFAPTLDTRLVQLLPGPDAPPGNSANDAVIERVLELLEVVSSSARIVPALAHLMRGPNLRLRAKAALVIGRRVGNSRLAENFLQQEDPRVRANAIESLWGGTAPATGSVLWLAAKDTNNRVAGNALLGLYQLQDRKAVGQILVMAAGSDPVFRATAAWTMGQTSDPRFLPALEKLARDLYASVRKNALKAIDRIGSARSAASLQVRILRARDVAPGLNSLSIQALGPEGDTVRGLLPGQFILWKDDKLITSYEAIEHVNSSCLGVGFALCAGGGISVELLKDAEEAVLGCLKLKAKEHDWAIAKFVSTPGAGPRIEPAIYLPEAGKLEKNIAEPPVATPVVSSVVAALRSLLPGAVKVHGDRHVILLAGSELVPSAEMEEQADSAMANKVAIHIVVVGTPQRSLESLCLRTQGIVMSVAGGAELSAAFRNLYLALVRHYEIRFSAALPVRLEVHCRDGFGTCGIGL